MKKRNYTATFTVELYSYLHSGEDSTSLLRAGARLLGRQWCGSDHGLAGVLQVSYTMWTARQHYCSGMQNISLSPSKWELLSRKKKQATVPLTLENTHGGHSPFIYF